MSMNNETHAAASGNAAKLREAAETALKTMRGVINSTISPRSNTVFDCRDKLSAALAAPPRNCDRFATVEDARKAHEAICEKYSKCHNGCPLNNEEHYSAFDCFEAWLFAPATERKGETDGN